MIKYLSVLFTLMFSNILLKAQLQQLARQFSQFRGLLLSKIQHFL